MVMLIHDKTANNAPAMWKRAITSSDYDVFYETNTVTYYSIMMNLNIGVLAPNISKKYKFYSANCEPHNWLYIGI